MAAPNTFSDKTGQIALTLLDENFEYIDTQLDLKANSSSPTLSNVTLTGTTITNRINFNNSALIAGDANGTTTNIDHIWYNDGSSPYSPPGAWNFCADTTYQSQGNANLIAGSLGLGSPAPEAKIHIKSTSTDTTNEETFILLERDLASTGGDLDTEKSYIDFKFIDTNANFTPQVRIGAEVGNDDGDANTLNEEGSGAFIVETSYGTNEDGTGIMQQNLRVNYLGSVTKPNTPYFHVGKNGVATIAAGNVIVFNVVNHNIQNCYNSSNGRFTAPVDGRYLIVHQNIAGNNGNVNNDVYLRINGSNWSYSREDSGSSNWVTYTHTQILNLNKNDYVDMYVNTGQVYGNNSNWCTFMGYLLG